MSYIKRLFPWEERPVEACTHNGLRAYGNTTTSYDPDADIVILVR